MSRPALHHVILAGGSGTRFWPASRKDRPKQFLALAGPEPMIRQTFERCAHSGPVERIFVSAGEEHRAAVAAALPAMAEGRFIAEPMARNTAPAVGLCALRLHLEDPEAVAVFCPADHVYASVEDYREAIAVAAEAAVREEALLTLGIRPTRAETGYGYIEGGERTDLAGVFRAERFIEKPDAETAYRLASSGKHYWNSGVFIWRVASILEAIRRHHPVLAAGLDRIRAAVAEHPAAGRDPFSPPAVRGAIEEVFAAQPSISIDYAVMEKAGNVLVVPCDPGWSDVGSWDAAAEMAPGDAAGNAVEGDVLVVDGRGLFVRGGARLVALVGVEDLIVVDTPDALLVCRRGSSQKVREVVAALAKKGRADLL